MPKVYNKYHQDAPDGAIYIGRPTKWGNPFVMGRGLSREFVIEKYKEWLFERPELIEEAKRELAGKDLICYCAPKACHGDVLIEVANQLLDRPFYPAKKDVSQLEGYSFTNFLNNITAINGVSIKITC